MAEERETLLIQVQALKEKLAEQREEKGQVDHYKQVRGGVGEKCEGGR